MSATVARGAFGSVLLGVFGLGLVFGLQILLARLSGAVQFGVYSYVLAWVEVLGLLAALGLDTATLRYLPAYRAQAEWAKVRGFLMASTAAAGASSVFTAAVTAVIVWLIRPSVGTTISNPMLVGALLIPVNVLLQITAAHLHGLQHIYRSQLPGGAVRPVTFAAVVVAYVWMTGRPLDAVSAILCNVCAAVASLVVAGYWFYSSLPQQIRATSPEYRQSEWIATSMPLLLGAGLNLLMQRVDVLMIGAMLDTTQAGIYSVALRMASLSVLGITAVNMVTIPLFSKFHHTNDGANLQRSVSSGSAAVAVLASCGVAATYVLGARLLGLFGPEFVDGLSSLRILLIGQIVFAATWPVGMLASVTGFQKPKVLLLGGALLLNILLNVVLVPTFGIIGAAVSSAVALAGWQVAMAALLRKRLQIDPTLFSMRLLRA